jgi:hypothetical protein
MGMVVSLSGFGLRFYTIHQWIVGKKYEFSRLSLVMTRYIPPLSQRAITAPVSAAAGSTATWSLTGSSNSICFRVCSQWTSTIDNDTVIET